MNYLVAFAIGFGSFCQRVSESQNLCAYSFNVSTIITTSVCVFNRREHNYTVTLSEKSVISLTRSSKVNIPSLS